MYQCTKLAPTSKTNKEGFGKEFSILSSFCYRRLLTALNWNLSPFVMGKNKA